MTKDKHKTRVIFRKFKKGGDIIALFPELPGTNKWYADCESYMHTGQHGAASIDIASVTKRAEPHEVAPLKKELEGIGYNLEVITKFTPQHLTARKRAIERIA
jgi:hypothetical protein